MPTPRHAETRHDGRARRSGPAIALALLQALVEANGSAPISALCAAVGAPRSTVYRVCRTLRGFDLIEPDGRGAVRLGALATALALRRDDALRRQDAARISRRAPPDRPGRSPSFLILRHEDALGLSRRPAGAHRSKLRIGFSNASLDNPWRVALVHSIEFAAAHYAEIGELQVFNAGNAPERQAGDIRRFAGDGLIVSATHGPAIAGALAELAARGTPAVLVDRGISSDAAYAGYVGTDNDAIGRTMALWLAEFLGGRGRIVLLAGREDAEPARQRLAGALGALRAFPEIQPLGSWWTGWQRDRADALMTALIADGAPIDGVWCDSGLQGAGSMNAFLRVGRGRGAIPPHTGGDLNLVYKLALRHRIPLATRDYPPAMGLKAVELLLDYLQGRAVPRRVEVSSGVVITAGHATRSVQPDRLAEEHVRWDLPDDLILQSGLGPGYDPVQFRVNYPGNRYNRSVARDRRGARHAEP